MTRTLIAVLSACAMLAGAAALAQDTGGDKAAHSGKGTYVHVHTMYARKHNPFCAKHPHSRVCAHTHATLTPPKHPKGYE